MKWAKWGRGQTEGLCIVEEQVTPDNTRSLPCGHVTKVARSSDFGGWEGVGGADLLSFKRNWESKIDVKIPDF